MCQIYRKNLYSPIKETGAQIHTLTRMRHEDIVLEDSLESKHNM